MTAARPVSIDVAVVGAGPAGLAAAIALARAGLSVAVTAGTAQDGGRVRPRAWAAETFPPQIRLPLEELGVWERFVTCRFPRSPGVVVAWGSPEPFANDFVTNPYGDGWHVDRRTFDAMLATAATEAGVHWVVATTPEALGAGLLVDATGRASAFTRARTGYVRHDHLVALTATVAARATPAREDGRALVEAAPCGWWYSAPTPGGDLAVAYFTDADLVAAGAGDAAAHWRAHLADAPLTAVRTGPRPAAAAVTVRTVAAGTSRAAAFAGDGWLVTGDAATAHDPLFGQGTLRALEHGLAAAAAASSSPGRDAYADETERHWRRYLAQRARNYGQETRWPDSPFWQRRQAATTRNLSTGGDEPVRDRRAGRGSHDPALARPQPGR